MSFSKWFFSRLGHRASRHWLRVKNGGQKNNFPVIPPRSTGRTRHKSPVGSINHQNSAHISPSSEPRLPFSFSSLHKEIISWRGKKKKKLVSITGRLSCQLCYEGVQMTVWHAGICMPQPPCWSTGVNIPTAEWWMTVVCFCGCVLIHQPRPGRRRPPEEVFSSSPRWGEKQNSAQEQLVHRPINTCGREACLHTSPAPPWTYGNVSSSPEMLANVRTCGQLGTGPHTHSLQLWRGGRGPSPCCPALPRPHQPSSPTYRGAWEGN